MGTIGNPSQFYIFIIRGLLPSITLLITLVCPAKASFLLDKKNLSAYQQILNFNIPEAHKLIQEAKKENPSNLIPIYLENQVEFLQLISSNDESSFDSYKTNKTVRIEQIKASNETQSPYYLYTQAEIYLEWAMLELNFNEYATAAWDMRHAYTLIQENKELFPNFILNNKVDGILNIALGTVPENYTWIINLFGFHGSRNHGIQQLKLLADSESPFRTEAGFILQMSQFFLLGDKITPVAEITKMYHKKDSPLIIAFGYAILMIKNNQGEAAKDVLISITKQLATPNSIIYKMLADTYFYKGEYDKARFYFVKFLQTHKGKRMLKDVYFKLYMSYWLEGNNQKAYPFIAKIKNHGTAELESDKRAEKFSEHQKDYHPILTKARFYCDGGYYDKAELLLQTINPQKLTDNRYKIEYFYRTGRILQATGDHMKALEFYKKTIQETGSKDYYYFAPSAALQAGFIYLEEKNKTQAIEYFNLAKRYKNHEYKNSIDYKANEALKHL